MCDELLEQYQIITDKLEQIENEEMDDLISSFGEILIAEQNLSATVQKTDQDSGKQLEHNKAKFALLCLKVVVNCQMLKSGYGEYEEQLQPDISKAIKQAESIEYKWRIDNAVLDDALNIMLAFCPECEGILTAHLEKRYRAFYWEDGEVTQDMYHLFHVTADYYRQCGWDGQAVVLLEYLCFLSRKRNSAERHRELVVKILAKIGDDEPEVVCRIGRADADQFEGIVNEYAGDFFWFYACSLNRLGDRAAAENYLKKCYHIRTVLYGEENWYTAIVNHEYHKMSFISSDGQHGLKELLGFIDKIENGMYDYIDELLLAAEEGKTLYIVLWDKSNLKNMSEYDIYLSRFERICEEYNDTSEPLLKKRVAKNLRGRYWMEKCDYMQAEIAFQEAIQEDTAQEMTEPVTEVQIKSNLLTIYCLQNDLEQALPLFTEIYQLIEEDECGQELSEKDIYRIYALMTNMEIQNAAELSREEIEALKDIVWDTCLDVQEDKTEISEYAEELAVFLVCSLLQIIQNEAASMEEQRMYLDVLYEIEKDIDFFISEPKRRMFLYLIMALLTWNLEVPGTEIYINRSVALLESSKIPKSSRASVLQTAAMYFGKSKRYVQSVNYVNRSLHEITLLWQSYVRYLNDMRLMQILNPAQTLYGCCYAILRKHTDIETAYESVLQFKALASLAGRERNRILHNGQYEKKLLNEIKILQDKIAMLETEQMLRDITDEFMHEEKKLRSLEAEFAQQFPYDMQFVNITLEDVKKAAPNDIVIIEYFLCALDYGIRQFEKRSDTDYTGIDIYIFKKKNDQSTIRRITVSDGLAVLEDASEFVNILQAESAGLASIEQIYKKDDIRIRLYQNLIAPVLPYIQEQKVIYIAPDYDLVNLPFEILFGEEEERLGDVYSVIKIECARDFLFRQSGYPATKGSLIIGNPQYEIDKRKLGGVYKEGTEKSRIFIREKDAIARLPFSQLEIQLIGKRSNSRFYCSIDAAKRLLLSANGYKNIHIATHGYFDLTEKDKTVFSSCMLFAGVKNWLETGEISEIYGNGIITADEVSRLDLRSVELAVLSSCLNGMSEAAGSKEFHGMVGALSAAGVHYVISNLWSADDFGTAVLMDVFYYLYIEKKQTPPEALRMAKNYLRNITVGQLRKRKWFQYIKKQMPDLYKTKAVQECESYGDKIRPFKNEAYWGGFSCYRCNGW